RRAVGGEPEGVDFPLAPLGPEPDAAIPLGPDVLLVEHAPARRPAAVLGHAGQVAVGAAVVVVGITIIAAVDMMRDAGPPAVAVVGVVVREQVVPVVEVRLQMVAGAGGEDLQATAVGPAAQHAAAADLDLAAVLGAGRAGDPLVADRDIKIA